MPRHTYTEKNPRPMKWNERMKKQKRERKNNKKRNH
jgi:hypothetical protein